MKLKTIKLAGFKSFADVTTIPLQSQMTAIVGPNGCGKSNVVDAVRCVLSGAARHLRGESLPDVIFNGSGNRKPVGQAAVEMVFDNSDGSLGGEYATYPEICVRREINRDGQSNYSLNGTRCRRRDITDIFLGTGLGPQSYAIIEQGMISRFIEAKPEDLRIYLEEAAGISKYKERRRETENRIQHARENLERLTDHRTELEKQLSHLKRQASAAERYKELRQEERLLKAQLQGLYFRALAQQITQQETTIQQQETHLESRIAEQRKLDASLEKQREDKIELSDAFSEVQARFYALGAEIASLEQQVKNGRDRKAQLQRDLNQLHAANQELKQNHEQDQLQAEELSSDLGQLEPDLEQAKVAAEEARQLFVSAEQAMGEWQSQWDEFNHQAAKTARQMEVEKTNTHHLEQTLNNVRQRISRFENEHKQFNFELDNAEIAQLNHQMKILNEQIDNARTALNDTNEQINLHREKTNQLTNELDQSRHQLQSRSGRRSSLEALQQAALGKNDNKVKAWLQQQQLEQQPRLVENIHATAGWEVAVETVLGSYLEALCINDITQFSATLESFTGNLSLVKLDTQAENNSPSTTLASKIESSWSLQELVQNIYTAENLVEATTMMPSLKPHESVITRDGIWVGRNWLRIAKNNDSKAGVLQRDRELKELGTEISQLQATIASQELALQEAKIALTGLESKRSSLQQQLQQLSSQHSQLQANHSVKTSRLEQAQQREAVIVNELAENQHQLSAAERQLVEAKNLWESAAEKSASDAEHKQLLLQEREDYKSRLEQNRQAAKTKKEASDDLQMRLETTRNQLHYLRQNITRTEKQLLESAEREQILEQGLAEIEQPLQQQTQELQNALESRLTLQHELDAARQKLNHTEHALREIEKERSSLDTAVQELRGELEQCRMKLQAHQIRQNTHQEKIIELEWQLDALLAAIPEQAQEQEWQEQIARIENKIQRLGAINLAAIDEYNQLAERKNYLDAQDADLVEALTTLENAIRKIDKESRTRLQETYDKVNHDFNGLFQRIFNGGSATMELTGDDLLATGIIVKAQPPGKRNSTIHLLSGGEKALVAVALVFALFQLNPSPFCILDEVDAPLDDVNVGRFCNLVKEMSTKVQFIFISHNKLAMETAGQLIGVTMNEPGVSRLVSVDIDQAIAMATAG